MSSTTATNTRVELLRRIVRDARQVLDGTMADVTQAQVEYIPPGIANPLGATYAHVVCSEDMVVQGMFRQSAPLFASGWARPDWPERAYADARARLAELRSLDAARESGPRRTPRLCASSGRGDRTPGSPDCQMRISIDRWI